VMVFDEATSSLDSATEAEIQKAIHAVAAGRTTLTIAHRLSTIAGADLILVLDKGSVAEQGTHSELLSKRGLYYHMWMRQQKTSELQADLSRLAAEEAAHAAQQTPEGAPRLLPRRGGEDGGSGIGSGHSHGHGHGGGGFSHGHGHGGGGGGGSSGHGHGHGHGGGFAHAHGGAAAASPEEPALSIRVDPTPAPAAVVAPAVAAEATPSSVPQHPGTVVAAPTGQSDYAAALVAMRAASPPPPSDAAASSSNAAAVRASAASPEPRLESDLPSPPTSPSLREVRRQMSAAVSRAKKGGADAALSEPLLAQDPSDEADERGPRKRLN